MAVAEDIVQDTFIKALKNINQLQDDTKIKPWLFKIPKNTYLTYVSKNIQNVCIDEVDKKELPYNHLYIPVKESLL